MEVEQSEGAAMRLVYREWVWMGPPQGSMAFVPRARDGRWESPPEVPTEEVEVWERAGGRRVVKVPGYRWASVAYEVYRRDRAGAVRWLMAQKAAAEASGLGQRASGLVVPKGLGGPADSGAWKELTWASTVHLGWPTVVGGINAVVDAINAEGGEIEAPDPPALPVRTSSEPVVGWRTWKVVEDGYGGGWCLVSPSQGTTWPGPILRADAKPCAYDPHDRRWRDRGDHCHGIYAHDVPCWSDWKPGRAMGAVEATGRVVIHEKGWRAERVRIVELVLHPSVGEAAIEGLEQRYECPVERAGARLECGPSSGPRGADYRRGAGS